MYYVSWNPSFDCRCTRCFSSEVERDEFVMRIIGIRNANVRTWEYFPE